MPPQSFGAKKDQAFDLITAQPPKYRFFWGKVSNSGVQAEKLGLNADEISFYRALIQNESAVRELGDNNLRELAKYITEQLRNSTTVDWAKRESVRARLRNLVRRALRKWKYPPDKADEAVELCLKQAEVLSEGWSAE